ncbi:uncharacterized protein LOC134820344 isoform X1 [Bolinopsis microptera]|uniref:uncharacterized protein LOC134820344 isoform X1 n=1 Tax=Bolinopsis microptera TaxID=2820187 RepID=UPI00307A6E01
MDSATAQPKGKRRRIESSKSSESESNVSKKEKAAVIPTASGSKDGIKTCNRNSQMMWDTTKKGIFFDAVNEFGKDFDKIHNYFNTKIKKVYGNVDTYHAIKKEQVKDFYQNTLKKTYQIVDAKKLHNLIVGEGSVDEANIREYREVIILLSYWQVMKHSKRMKWPTDKLHSKVNELIFQGSTCLRMKSRNFYVQRVTPKYFVGRRVGRVPAEFTVDILPFNSWSWGVVQNIAQNPRIRLKVSSKKSVSEILKILISKWEKAKQCSTLETLNLCLRAPTSSKYRPEHTKTTADSSAGRLRKQSVSLNSEDTSKNKTSTKTPIPRTKPTAPESADEHNVILNNLANEVDITCNVEAPAAANTVTVHSEDLGDVVTDPTLIDQGKDQNTSVTEEELNDIIDSVEPPLSDQSQETPTIKSKCPTEVRKPGKTFFHDKHKDTDELAAEKDRLAALECWDSTTPSSLTIGHVYMKFAPVTNSKEFHIEYEWRIDSGETSINSAHNTLSLKRLFNLGSTEFQRLSKQGKFKDLFITLNMDKWTSILPNSKSVETQTDMLESALPKPQVVSVAVQVGKDRLILPQPTKLGGFIVPAPVLPPPNMAPKTPPSSSFNLPNRPKTKRKQTIQRVLLPKPALNVTSTQLVVPRDIGCAAQVKAAPFCDANISTTTTSSYDSGNLTVSIGGAGGLVAPVGEGGGVDLSSLVPDIGHDKQQLYKHHLYCDRQFGDIMNYSQCNGYDSTEMTPWNSSGTGEAMSTLNSLVAEHSNHSLTGDSRGVPNPRDPMTSRDMMTSRDHTMTSHDGARAVPSSILDDLGYHT